jgi:hypothetical protein
MLTWNDFQHAEPELAEAGRALLYFFGVGLAFLATTRRSGAPRLHPICVIQTGEGLYGLIVPSYKLADLRRDGRYALHSYPLPHNEDAFNLSGRAEEREEARLRASVIDAFIGEAGRAGPALDPSHFEAQTLVEFLVESCLLTRTSGHGDPSPRHRIWKAPETA